MTVEIFSGAVALIVGGSSGIGLETACQLASGGCTTILLCGRDEQRGLVAVRQVYKAGCDDVRFVQGDASEAATIERCSTMVAQIGALEILVNAVPGNSTPKPFAQQEPRNFASLIRVHLESIFGMTHALLPYMQIKGGTIINISSDAAKIPTPGESVHGALMAAIAMFSRTLALEEARNRIRVHALTPSLVADTISYERMMADPFSAKLFAKAEARATLGMPVPADIAAIAVFLCSPAAQKMTGQTITVNGGIAIA